MTYFQISVKRLQRFIATSSITGVHFIAVKEGHNPLYAPIVFEGEATNQLLEKYKESHDLYVYSDHLPHYRENEVTYLRAINGF